jgi:hypothetical protein
MKDLRTKKPAALAIAPIDRSTLSPAESRMIAAARRVHPDVRDLYTEAMEICARDHPMKTAASRPALKLVKVGRD